MLAYILYILPESYFNPSFVASYYKGSNSVVWSSKDGVTLYILLNTPFHYITTPFGLTRWYIKIYY